MMGLVITVDIDGTLLVEDGIYDDWLDKKPKMSNIDAVNNLYEQGHTIIMYTARSSELRDETEQWLKKHKVKYDSLVMDKVPYDIFVEESRKMRGIEYLAREFTETGAVNIDN